MSLLWSQELGILLDECSDSVTPTVNRAIPGPAWTDSEAVYRLSHAENWQKLEGAKTDCLLEELKHKQSKT